MRIRHLLSVASFLAPVTASGISAAGVTWDTNGFKYLDKTTDPDGGGSLPAIVFTSTASSHLHQGSSSHLWFDEGPYKYDSGYAPAEAADGIGNFIEIHQANSGASNFWFRFAQTTVSGGTTLVNWKQMGAIQKDQGMNPSIAAWGLSASGDIAASGGVIQVHQAGAGVGPLWANVASVQFQGFTNVWTGVNFTGAWIYDQNGGEFPSIATDGNNVIEVHQAGNGVSALWYRVGTWGHDSHGNPTVTFGNSFQINAGSGNVSGQHASVTMCNGTVVEVDEEPSTQFPQALVSHTGKFTCNGLSGCSFAWDNGSSNHYDNGFFPKVSCLVGGGAGARGLEVHQASQSGLGDLWTHGFHI
jgi:hypothetical protein